MLLHYVIVTQSSSFLLLIVIVVTDISGVTMTLSTQIEGKTFNEGGHKFGLGLDFEA